MHLREGAFGRAPTFGRVASYRAAKMPRDRAAFGVSSHSGNGRSRGASGEGVSSCPAMERAASTPAESLYEPRGLNRLGGPTAATAMSSRAHRMRRPIPAY